MDSIEQMLKTWQRSTSIMHIANHIAASRFAKLYYRIGTFVTALSAIVSSTLFISIQNNKNENLILIAGIISLIAAILVGIFTFLNLSKRSQIHLKSAAAFQALRREIEEELAHLNENKQKENYKSIRDRSQQTFESSVPLPQRIHDKVKKEIVTEHKE